MNNKPLYIFLHIPKTAGYTLRYHFQKNLKESEQLFLCYEPLGLDIYDPPASSVIYKNKAFSLIKKLSREKREKIKLIHGHTVFYGVHEFFEREVRYVTFVRNPIDRTISIYNHLCFLYQKEGQVKRNYPYFKKYLIHKGLIPDFNNWLKYKYISEKANTHLSQLGWLKEQGYLNKLASEKDIEVLLKIFYFVGITENFSQESLYFYNELGMNKYFWDQNISKKYFNNRPGSKTVQDILNKNKYDNMLYVAAVKKNIMFKNNNPNFESVVDRKSLQRKIFLPFTQTIFAPGQTFKRITSYLMGSGKIIANPRHYSDKVK